MSADAAKRILTQRLESLARAGVQQIGRVPPPSPTPHPVGEGGRKPGAGRQAATLSPESPMPKSARPVPLLADSGSLLRQPYPAPLPTIADRQTALEEQRCQVAACQLCPVLVRNRSKTVYGVGTAAPRVAFFGEAPGADEDRQGEPFIGRAGQLLTKIIEACGWQRSDVYIMNTLKCRPPDNRTPAPDELANCRPFWERQLEILQPEFIVCAGGVAAQALLETTESVGKLRGRFHKYRGSTVLVTYHPSYLLRNPDAKKYVWDDMKKLLKEMGLPVPGRG
ncbi:MAG TPA: uracil-DNA glycosylase [Pirellulaceae bacterium]|nr:uracil-DNA glycosylase [Pirellulaceae bacterium]